MSGEDKTYTWEEVAEHNNSESLWMVIHDIVYDVTKFMEEHPGGEEVLLEQAGKDGTVSFEDVGHSPDAREMAESYRIGRVSTPKPTKVEKKTSPNTQTTDEGGSWFWPAFIGILLVIIASYFYKNYL